MKLCALPTTTEAFSEHVKRTHFQVCIWKSALEKIHHNILAKEDVNKTNGIKRSSSGHTRNTSNGCAKEEPCSNGRCSCVLSKLACTPPFCNCYGEETRCNSWTKLVPADTVDDLSDEENNN